MRRVSFDESGNTGPDLLNRHQRLFVLASHALDQESATAVLADAGFPVDEETKSAKTLRSRPGRQLLLNLARDDRLAKQVAIGIAEKTFFCTAKLVSLVIDWHYEKVHGRALELKGRNALRVALRLYDALTAAPGMLSRDGRNLLLAFLTALRSPSEKTINVFAEEMRRLVGVVEDEVVAQALRIGADGAPRVTDWHIDHLDPGLPLLFAVAHLWEERLGDVELLHDNRDSVARWQRRILEEQRRERVGLDIGEGVILPRFIAGRGLELAHSHRHAAIQLADLLAGISRAFMAEVLWPDSVHRSFASELLTSTLPTWEIIPIYAHHTDYLAKRAHEMRRKGRARS